MISSANLEFNFFALDRASQYEVVAQGLYVYGYAFVFLEEIKLTRVFCGEPEFLAVQHQFKFLLDMDANYGYLNTYGGGDPRALLAADSDPTLLGYYVTEHSNAMRRALYCIVSYMRLMTINYYLHLIFNYISVTIRLLEQ